MPGKVSTPHAKLESDCAKCHDRADRNRQAKLCMDCHKDVGADVQAHTGFHGRLPASKARSARPATPNTSAATPTSSSSAARRSITRTRISHWRARTPRPHAANATSRARNTGPRPAPASTATAATTRMAGKFGKDCASCHEVSGWAKARFDHGKTKFALRDRHAEIPCASCHAGNRYAGTPMQCVSCHAPDDVHRGSRGADCASCHNTAVWKGTKFDHLKETRLRAHWSTCEPQLSGLSQDREPEGSAAEGLPRLSPGRRCACHALRHCVRTVPLDRRLEAGGFRPYPRREIHTRRRAHPARLPRLPYGAGGDAKARQ